jgi:hypothetical protein
MTNKTSRNTYLVWENRETGERVRSAAKPTGRGRWDALYAESRVRKGVCYTPYEGKNEWEVAANAAMSHNARP